MVTRSDLALAALACAAVPGMKPVSVAGLTSPDPDDLEVQRALVEDTTGRSWVVHAPLNPVAGARLARNDELVRQLARHLPFKVPTPAGYAPLGKDGAAVVYPHVEGSPLDLSRLPAGPGLTSAVGRAVAAVHNVPRGVFEEQDVPVFDAATCRQRATAEVDRAAETGRVPTGLLARWEEAFDAPAMWQFATTPVHGSFTGRSVLVAFADERDAASGRVVAVTDWGEAMVGDPASDLAALYAQASPQAWEATLDSYALARTHRPDPYLHARARLIAETRTLRGLAAAVADGDEERARRIVEVLRRMDRLTEDEDSLVPVTARPRAGASGVTPALPDTADDDSSEPLVWASADGDPWAEQDTSTEQTDLSGTDLSTEQVAPPGAAPVEDVDDVDLTIEVPPVVLEDLPAPDGTDTVAVEGEAEQRDADPVDAVDAVDAVDPGDGVDPVDGVDTDPVDHEDEASVDVQDADSVDHEDEASADVQEADSVDHEDAQERRAEDSDAHGSTAGDDQVDPVEAREVGELGAQERLSELYGMPESDLPSQEADEAGGFSPRR